MVGKGRRGVCLHLLLVGFLKTLVCFSKIQQAMSTRFPRVSTPNLNTTYDTSTHTLPQSVPENLGEGKGWLRERDHKIVAAYQAKQKCMDPYSKIHGLLLQFKPG